MITKEAIEAALNAYYGNDVEHGRMAMAQMEAALTAAFAAMPGPAVKVETDTLRKAAEAGWDACRRQVFLLAEDYINRTYPMMGVIDAAGNFYRGQYDVAKSFAKAFNAFEALDCDYFQQIDFSALAAAEECGRSEERERCAKLELTLTRTLGALGAAFDPPGPHRAYTYEHQPHNGPAYNLGCAVAAAKNMPAGDEIDVGLALLKAMQARGFGVFEIKPSAVTKEPTP